MAETRILIVEDEQITALDIKRRLERLGYAVTGTTGRGEEAIDMIREKQPDLVLLDIMLASTMDGIDTAAEIRRNFNIPHIFMTAHMDMETVKRAKKTDPYGYIVKPFKTDDIYSAIETGLHKHEIVKKLIESEEKYRNLVESINDVIFTLDENGIVLYISPQSENLTGYSVEELTGRPFSEFIFRDDLPELIERFNEVKSGTIVPSEYRIVKKTGEAVWVRSSSKSAMLGGKLSGIHGILTDISGKKLAQEKLLEKEIYYRLIIENLPQKIFMKNSESVYISCNMSFAEDLGIHPMEISGKTDYDFFSAPLAEKYRDDDKKIMDGVRAVELEEKYSRGGKEYWINSVKTPVKDMDGNVSGLLGIFWDITGKKKLEDKRLKLNRELEEKVDERTSELKNILSALEEREEALKRSEELFRSAFENAKQGMFLADGNGKYIQLNRAFCEIVGYTEEELLNRDFRSITYPDDRKEELEIFNAFISNRINVHQNEKRFIHKSGQIVWALRSMSVIRGDSGEVQLFISQITDISVRKKAEDALKSALYLTHSMGKYSIDELIDLGLEEGVRITESKIGFFHFFDQDQNTILLQTWTKETLKGCTAAEKGTHYPLDQAGVWVECVHQKKPVIHNDYESLTNKKGLPEGHAPVIREMSIPIFENDRIVAVIGVGNRETGYRQIDIDHLSLIAETTISIVQRKKAEQALVESEKQYRTLYETMAQGVVYQDSEGRITSANPSAQHILGLSLDQMQGRESVDPRWRSIHDDGTDYPGETHPSMEALSTGKVIKDRVMGVFNPQYEEMRWININAVPQFKQGSSKPYQVYATFEDITERKLFEEKLRESRDEAEKANRAKSEFLANMSHEIRTPLNAVIGFSEILASTVTDETQLSYLKSIKTSGNSLLTLINDILDLSKIEAGKMEFQLEPVSLELIINDIRDIFILKAEEKGLDLILDIDDELPPALLVDEIRIRQVLLNIVGNAIKFTKKGYIKVSAYTNFLDTERSRVDLILSIEDTGIGIQDVESGIIFDSFRQQDSSVSKNYGGTGLGLTISKKLVEMMGGRIEVKSKNKIGSTFKIVLKNVETAEYQQSKPNMGIGTIKKVEFKNATVLVIDDIESNRILIRELLRGWNINVLEAENGEGGVALSEKAVPDLILMDIRMPGMDGLEATRNIKSNPATSKIPVIALTASVKKADRVESDKAGLDGFLLKPINVDELLAELMKYLVYEKQEVQKEHASASTGSDIEKEIGKVENLPQFTMKLLNDILPQLERLAGAIKLKDVKSAGTDLVNISNQHNAGFMIEYGELLLRYTANFDITGIKNTISVINQVLTLIKNHGEHNEKY